MTHHNLRRRLPPIHSYHSDSDDAVLSDSSDQLNHFYDPTEFDPPINTQVVVYILTQNDDDPSSEAITLSKLFSDDLFIVQLRNIPAPVGMNNNAEQSAQQSAEAYRVTKCLKDARRNYPSMNVLIVKDNCITVARRKSITNICRSICDVYNWDICYLTKWLDRCDLHENRQNIPGESASLAQSKSPHGIQALMFSPSGRDILIGKKSMRNGVMFPTISRSLDVELNDVIEKNHMIAYCVNPNVFTFNTSHIKSITDLAKLSECRRPEDKDYLDKNVLSLNWYIFAILCTLLLVLIIWMVTQRHRSKEIFNQW